MKEPVVVRSRKLALDSKTSTSVTRSSNRRANRHPGAHGKPLEEQAPKPNAKRKPVPTPPPFFTPSRFGANPAEAISRENQHKLFKRYGIGFTPHCAQFPASCYIKMRKIDFQKDMLSATAVLKYYDGEYAKHWKRLKMLEKKHNIQLLRPARIVAV